LIKGSRFLPGYRGLFERHDFGRVNCLFTTSSFPCCCFFLSPFWSRQDCELGKPKPEANGPCIVVIVTSSPALIVMRVLS